MATLDEITNLGFVVTAGQVDRENVNYGFLSADGPVLTPEGEELVASLSRKGRRITKASIAEAAAAADEQ
jgi:hypothetical protein